MILGKVFADKFKLCSIWYNKGETTTTKVPNSIFNMIFPKLEKRLKYYFTTRTKSRLPILSFYSTFQ